MSQPPNSNSSPRPTMKVIGTKDPAITYTDRLTVRAILLNPLNNQVAIIRVENGKYFKLPAAASNPMKTTPSHSLEKSSRRPAARLIQISVHMTEDNGHPRLTELEIAEGLKHSFGSVQGAFLLMQEAKPTSELGEFIKERET
ncbi:hypothetical protein BDZ45DRAFT_752035 [Acephala macrosclerotiorum]|nr:hypothetical protein BDZ45DRAFT_752035 [Acephala macrosclerotiorum]